MHKTVVQDMVLFTAPTVIHDQGLCQTKQDVSGKGDPNQHLVRCSLNLFIYFLFYKRGSASCAATVHDALGVRKAAGQQAGHKISLVLVFVCYKRLGLPRSKQLAHLAKATTTARRRRHTVRGTQNKTPNLPNRGKH